MYVLHNLHVQLSQYRDFIFSLNIDRDEASLLELSSIIEVHGKTRSLDPFLLSFFFNYLQFFGSALGYSLFCELETYHELAGQVDRFRTYKFLS